MENKLIKDGNTSFELFIKNSLTAREFEELHETLGISKRMLTALFNNPHKLSMQQLVRLSNLMGKNLDDFKSYL